MNTLQKYLSYIQRIEVERRSSIHNKKLIVAIQNGKYVLNADHANYSFASLHRVFQQALKLVPLEKDMNVLVLGCGAGSIPSIIYHEMKLNVQITAVEIDSEVIALGKKYFRLGDYTNLNIVLGDALEYIKSNTQQFDLICVDVFDGIQVPNAFLSSHFFEHCKKSLNENGNILLNFVAYNHETKNKVSIIEKDLRTTFKQLSTYRFEGINRIFLAKK